MIKPWFSQCLTVQLCGLHITVGIRYTSGNNRKGFSFVIFWIELDCDLFKQWTSDLIEGFYISAAIRFEQAHCCHYKPCTHLSFIFITQPTMIRCGAIVAIHDLSRPLLGKPGFT